MTIIHPDVAANRARVASLSRSRKATDPDLVQARTDLAASKAVAHVARILEAAPPLTDAQRTRIAGLIGGASK